MTDIRERIAIDKIIEIQRSHVDANVWAEENAVQIMDALKQLGYTCPSEPQISPYEIPHVAIEKILKLLPVPELTIAELARLRQHICEEILTYGESKREGPDLALTLDRIFAAFEIAGYTRPAQPAEELTPKPGMAMHGCNDAHGFTGTSD